MVIKSKAPFRIGLAGGGSDVSPYSDLYGGAVLNTTINLYAKSTIIPRNDNHIVFENKESGKTFEFETASELPLNGIIDLQIGVYNHIAQYFSKKPLAFTLTTEMDVPTGSGLGTSSTLVVAVLGAFLKWLKINLSPAEIAQLAFKIEREELKMAGGKQDQYAAAFGGINFLTFGKTVEVEKLQLSQEVLNDLQENLILFHNKSERKSSEIIEEQMKNIQNQNENSILATHNVREEAFIMKAALQSGNLAEIGHILNRGWKFKKQLARGITNQTIDEIYETALFAGALGGKISGAGGGGFMLFYVPAWQKEKVISALQKLGGNSVPYKMVDTGLSAWIEE